MRALSERYYDIHNHILPGLDDGPEGIQGSIELAEACIKDGASGIIATPHLRLGSDLSSFLDKRDEAIGLLVSELSRRGISLIIKAGAEVMLKHKDNVNQAYSDLGRHKKELSLGDSDLLLVEYPASSEPLWFEESLFRLQDIGFQPVLAHMERYPWLKKEARLEKLVDKGIYMQVNVDSLKGLLSPSSIRARRLARSGLVHFVATDAHDAVNRRPDMAGANIKLIGDILVNSERLFLHDGSDTLYI